jgi:DNA-binding NtrC family response regulator
MGTFGCGSVKDHTVVVPDLRGIGRSSKPEGGYVNKRTLQLLQSYPWPGNIRELQNVIECSVILGESDIFSIDESWLPLPFPRRLEAHEKSIIEEALRASRGRVFGPSGAAAKFGIPRSTLESKIRVLKINKHRFKTDTES